jgi:protein-tyrosine phosphatase
LLWRRRKQLNLHWITDDIAVSRQPSVDEWAYVRDSGINCVVDLRAEAPDNGEVLRQHEMCYLRVPIEEGGPASQDELAQIARWVEDHLDRHGPVLVHCREGRGRSPMAVIATLVAFGIPLYEAYKVSSRAHPGVSLNTDQQNALVLFAAGQARINASDK